jgi:hypothetical protein
MVVLLPSCLDIGSEACYHRRDQDGIQRVLLLQIALRFRLTGVVASLQSVRRFPVDSERLARVARRQSVMVTLKER